MRTPFGYATEGATLAAVGERTPQFDRIVTTVARGGVATVVREPRPSVGAERGDGVGRKQSPRAWSGGMFKERVLALKKWKHEPDGYLVNCVREDGTTLAVDVERVIQRVKSRAKKARIIVFLDEGNRDAVAAAERAGASMYLGAHEPWNDATLSWRVRTALRTAPSRPHEESRIEDGVRTSVLEALGTLPAPGEHRRKLAEDWTRIDTPDLRDAETGRLDARRIADRLGLSLSALARALGTSQQALSATPNAKSIQRGLAPIARLVTTLDELLSPEHRRMWLNTPREELGGSTPLDEIEAGRAMGVVGMVEGALEGSLA